MIEIKIKCFNPGCDIHYRIDEPPELTEDLAEVLDSATQNVIQVMNARELYYKQLQNRASQKYNKASGDIGFLPFKLQLDMDGISGMKIYNKIAINNNIRRKTKGVSLDKQVEKVKPKTMKPLIKKQKITKGGKY